MRHIILLIFSLIVTEISAQQVLFYRNDGTRVKLHISELDSIRFMDDDWVDPTGEPNRLPMKVIATFKGDNTANRIGMHRLHMGDAADGSNDKTMLWQEYDQISLFQGTKNNLFELSTGKGTREGTFSGIGTTGNATAIYPYRANMKFKDGTVSELILPTIQKASDGNCDPKAALMMGQTFVNNEEQSNNIETKIGFQNICSYLVIIPEQDLDRVIVTSRNVTDCLSGNVSVKYENGVPTLTATQNAFTSNKVTLQGPLKVGNTYYIAVLPGTLASGFVVTSYVSGSEKTITKQLSSSATFVRSKYHNCSSFTKGDGEGFVVDLELTGNGVHRYWSTRNIGASTPQDHGDYFAWGEVVPLNSYGKIRTNKDELKDVCTWKNYKYGDGSEPPHYNTGTFVQKYGGSVDSYFEQAGDDRKRELDPEDDAAHVIWGGEYWYMPSKADFVALLSQCKYEYIENYHGSGIRGYVFYNKNYTAEKGFTDDHVIDVIQSQESADYGKEITHIFLPYGGYYDDETIRNPNSDHGYYWSSTVEVNDQYNFARAHDLVMTRSESEGNVTTSVEPSDHADLRRGGQNIRPIYNRTFTESEEDKEAKAKIVLPVILPAATK